MADKQLTSNRDGFTSRWGFILACIGSAVGMGNIWRFPIMVSVWGGMTFLIPYFICVLLIGSTGVIGEFALGRATGAGPIGAFGECTALRGNRKIGEGIGFIPVIGSMALAIGYTVVMGWIFKYTFISITGDMHAMGQDMASIGGHFDVVAVNNVPCIIVAILASFAIMALGVSGGIEKANKIMMPALFVSRFFPAPAPATSTSSRSTPKGCSTRWCGFSPSARRSSLCPSPVTVRSSTAPICRRMRTS